MISFAQRDSETKCPVSISISAYLTHLDSWKVEGIPFEIIYWRSQIWIISIYLTNIWRNWTKIPNQFPKLGSDLKIKHTKSRVLLSTFILPKVQDLKFQLKDNFFLQHWLTFAWEKTASTFPGKTTVLGFYLHINLRVSTTSPQNTPRPFPVITRQSRQSKTSLCLRRARGRCCH